MKKQLLLLISIYLYITPLSAQDNIQYYIRDLKVDYLSNPLGVDSPQPRFSWSISGKDNRFEQKSYQILVSTDSLEVANGNANMWDSKTMESNGVLSSYMGKPLNPFTRYFWKVISWEQSNNKITSAVSSFETGMMDISNWQGAWISDYHDKDYKPAPYFRKTFDLKKKIRTARAYIAVAGLYELYINGEKIGNHRLEPMYTRFDRRNLYVVYDVTPQLREGKNAIGVLLGNGWYNHQVLAVWDFDRAPWRNRPAFCLDLHITYTDGTVETIASDRDWKTSSAELVYNNIYTGEHCDARLEQTGWNTIGFDDVKWNGVMYRAAPSQHIVSQQMQPIRNTEEIKAVSVNKLNDTTYIYDFGRNMSGVTKIKIKGDEGTGIHLKHGERLYPNGQVDLSNIDVYYRPKDKSEPFQTDIFILKGEGAEEFMPKFNYKGFRYVEVVLSKPMSLAKDNLTAYFMHSDVEQIGEISSSNPIIEKIQKVANSSYLSNLMGYPTDCPQREKNGWTGDGHFAIEAALYNFDAITIYEKWLADHRDEQQPNGVFPDIIPTGGWGYGTDNGTDWTSTIAIIPWNIYLFYGDSKLLGDCYENIKRYVDYITRRSPEGLTAWGRGDWVPVKSKSSLELTCSVYYYADTKIVAKAAKLFGNNEDYEYYTALAEKIRNAINSKYLNVNTSIYASGTQTEMSVPLYWGVTPDSLKQIVAQELAQKVIETNYHLDVGVLGAKAILNALSENGQAEVAYKLSVQDTYPSWGWWVANGATTLLENWDLKAERDISDNHMMFGEIGAWFYKGLGGIMSDEEAPGFAHIILTPHFVAGLDRFEARHRSPYGWIVSSWQKKGKTVICSVEIPPNSKATFNVPDNVHSEIGKIIKLGAGEHILKFGLK